MDDDFRYWSDRSLRETQAAINAGSIAAAQAHDELARLCMHRAQADRPNGSVADDAGFGQSCPG